MPMTREYMFCQFKVIPSDLRCNRYTEFKVTLNSNFHRNTENSSKFKNFKAKTKTLEITNLDLSK